MAADKRETAEKGTSSKRFALPELDEEGALDAAVAQSLTPDQLREICAKAGRTFGGMTVVGDKAYL